MNGESLWQEKYCRLDGFHLCRTCFYSIEESGLTCLERKRNGNGSVTGTTPESSCGRWKPSVEFKKAMAVAFPAVASIPKIDQPSGVSPPGKPWQFCPYKEGVACEQGGSVFTRWCEDCPK